jgi:mono/diheme cytochrome c family protein
MNKTLAALALGACALITTSTAQADELAKRGEYLATIMDCGGCHTRGALIGKPDQAFHLAGSDIGFALPGLGYFYPPNLTSDPDVGLGKWSAADLIKAIRTGVRPDGRVLAPVMPYHSYAKLSDTDAQALAHYLKTLKPVKFAAPPMTPHDAKPPAPYLTLAVPQ